MSFRSRIENTNSLLCSVAEAFGQLRVTTQGGNDRVSAFLDLAEAASGRICESCGAPSEVANRSGLLTTLCPVCLKATEVPDL